MRGGKDEEKLISPMFPRLHVNDTEKGGPRAPPRNKMALYEQLTIPTQRFSSGSPSATLPSTTSAPSTSSSHLAGHKRDIFSLSSKCSVQSHHTEKLHSYGSRGIMQNHAEAKLLKTTSPVATGPLSSNPQCSSAWKNRVLKLENFSLKNAREKDDLSILASDQLKHDVHNHDRERMSCSMSSSAQLGISGEPRADIGVTDLTSRKYVRNEAVEDPNLTEATRDPVERLTFIPSFTDDKPLVEANTCPSTKFKDSEKAKQPHPSLAKENRTSISNSNRLFGANVSTYRECSAEQSTEALRDQVGCTQVPGLENSSRVIRESCSALSPRDDGDRNLDNFNNSSRPSEYKKFSTVHLREVERHDNVSDASLIDSVPAPNISPDVVVELIGEKQFWNARKAIVHQQRIFAIQVFELHRLIKVQKLIAGSPHILLEDYLDKPPSTVSAVKSKPTECARQLLLSATVKDNHQLPNLTLNSKCADKIPLAKLPLPSFNKDNSKLAITPQASYELHVKDTPQTPTAAAPKSDPWCLNHPTPANQWLVPVMSPSEGLIYKPYTGLCPPSAGFMAPMYGNYRSMNLNTGNGTGDFYTTAYAVPTSHHQGFGYFPGTVPFNQTYFPPYGVPVSNQSMSGSAPDQMSLFARVKPKEQENQLSTGDINYLTHQENSCEMPSQTSHAMSFHVRKFHGPKGSELQGSTASSPSERGTGDVLPLFPTEPTVEESSANAETSEHKSRAIKVVPHHPTSATESAARIFQLIQEERKQL